MPLTANFSRSCVFGGSTLIQQETTTGNYNATLNQVVPIAANTQYHFAVTAANLQGLCIYAQVAMTVFTNNPSGSSPQDTIVLAAGQCLVWTLATDGIGKIPFSGNVTTIYVTNGSASTGTLAIIALCNQ
jgi:hypothetical protein